MCGWWHATGRSPLTAQRRSLGSAQARREAFYRNVLIRPRHLEALFPRRVARPVRVVEMAAGQRAEVGASSRQDRIDVGVRRDGADGHRQDPRLVTDAVAGLPLVAPSVRLILVDHRLAG